jgi:membrane-associated phospholipid phosphatase
VQHSALRTDPWLRPAEPTTSVRGWLRFASQPMALGILAAAAGFALLAVAASLGVASHWEFELSFRLNRIVEDAGLNPALDAALVLASAAGAALVCGTAAVLAMRRRPRPAVLLLLSLGLPLGLAPVLKLIVRRPSLLDAGGAYSFPSGNAAVAAGVLVTIVLLTSPGPRRRAAAAGAALLFALFGVGLVASAWHYPSDVAGGCLLGLLCSLLLHPLMTRIPSSRDAGARGPWR